MVSSLERSELIKKSTADDDRNTTLFDDEENGHSLSLYCSRKHGSSLRPSAVVFEARFLRPMVKPVRDKLSWLVCSLCCNSIALSILGILFKTIPREKHMTTGLSQLTPGTKSHHTRTTVANKLENEGGKCPKFDSLTRKHVCTESNWLAKCFSLLATNSIL